MSIILGENLVIGVGAESTRNTAVAPESFVEGRTPTGINVEVVKALIKETKASKNASQGSEIVQRKAGGGLEFNLKSETVGYLLLSLLGKSTPSVVSGSVVDHLFEILPNNVQHPTLTFFLSQLSQQAYEYPGAVVTSLEIRTPVDDLVNATFEMMATDEDEYAGSPVSPTYSSTNYIFRPYDVEIKLAANVAGLAAADAVNLKEFNISINNNGRSQQHIGSINPTDTIAGLFEIGGSLTLDYEDATYHDIYRDGTYKAMQIKLTRSDIDLGSGNNPTLTIVLPKISFEASNPDRPIDDIVRDSFDFLAHYDETEEEVINVTLRNTIADYNA